MPSPGSRHRQLDLDLEDSRLYFGGVPPDLDRSGWSAVSFVPLLGCVDDLQVGQTTQNPLVGNSTGVTRGCGGQVRIRTERGRAVGNNWRWENIVAHCKGASYCGANDTTNAISLYLCFYSLLKFVLQYVI